MGVIYVNDQIYSSNGIPKGGNAGQALIKKTNSDLDLEWADVGGGGGGSLPSGGTQGQVLTKNSSAAGDASWQDVDGLPSGGTAGQALIKKSSTDGDADWEDVNSLPSGGTSGQVLTKNSATAGDASWKDVDGLPSGGTAGQVLKKNSATAGDASWADPLALGETNTTAYAGDKGKANADHIGNLSNLTTDAKTDLVNAVNELDSVKGDVQELTMAQFDALTPAQKNNGTAYYVTDAEMGMKVGASGFTPIGTIISVMGTTAPANYLKCEGQTVNISDYPELADYFETQFGAKDHFGGDGTTTFGIPDLRGEFLRGVGTNSYANQGSGEALAGGHQDATEVNNTTVGNGDGVYFGAPTNSGTGGYSSVRNADGSVSATKIIKYNNTNVSAETSVPMRVMTRPTNTSVLYCIAVRNIYIADIDERNIYSTTEKIVGQWIDGRPIYQKTINFGTLPNNTTKSVLHNISSFDLAVNVSGYTINLAETVIFPLPFSSTVSTSSIAVNTTKTSVEIVTGRDRTDFTTCYITLDYLKTNS